MRSAHAQWPSENVARVRRALHAVMHHQALGRVLRARYRATFRYDECQLLVLQFMTSSCLSVYLNQVASARRCSFVRSRRGW